MKSHPTLEILRQMEAADKLSPSGLRQLQSDRLQEFIEYCEAHVPYVRNLLRDAGVKPSDIRGPEDLALLPIMTKADVRRNRESLRSEAAVKLSSYTTGGSSGDPLIFDLSKRRIASRVACRQRVSQWWGVSVGDTELAVWGAPIELTKQDHLRTLRDKLMSTRLLSAFEMNESTMSSYLDVFERSGCRQIFGYPSALYLLCVQARKQGRDLRRLGIKVAFVTSEVLFPYQRELIADTLNCPVANGYGGRDSGFIAHECPQGGMHVMADAVIVEIIDAKGQPVPPGEPGEIVVTDLSSHEAPFLRYATGDVGVLSGRRCPCGRALPLFERIDGRSNDSVVASDGRIINSLALVYPLREIEGIEHFRVYQKHVDCFHVQIVSTDRFPRDGEYRIRKAWVQLLRSPLDVTFEYLPILPVERSGKFRHVISELSAEHALNREEEHVTFAKHLNG